MNQKIISIQEKAANKLSAQHPSGIAFIGDSHLEQYSERVIEVHNNHRLNKDIFS